MSKLSYPDDFLHDIENMSTKERSERCRELIQWVKRHKDGEANPKWVVYHMNELARLAEIMRDHLASIHAPEQVT